MCICWNHWIKEALFLFVVCLRRKNKAQSLGRGKIIHHVLMLKVAHAFILSLHPHLRRAAPHHKGNMLWHPSGPGAPNIVRSWCRDLSSFVVVLLLLLHPSWFFLANTSTSWLRFSREWNVGCQQTSPSKAAAPSSARSAWLCPLFQPERSLAAAVHTRTHAEVKAVTSEGTVESQPAPAWRGSAPYNHPDVSNQLGFSSPASPTKLAAPPPAAGLDSKHIETETGCSRFSGSLRIDKTLFCAYTCIYAGR